MSDNEDVLRLIGETTKAGSKHVAVGDDRQLSPGGPGGAFRALVKCLGGDVWKPTDNVRQVSISEQLALLEAESESQTGRLAKSIDAWTMNELHRAGFDADDVWPRLTKPRVLPRDLALYLRGLPAKERVAEARVLANKTVAPSEARVLGRAYVKQA